MFVNLSRITGFFLSLPHLFVNFFLCQWKPCHLFSTTYIIYLFNPSLHAVSESLTHIPMRNKFINWSKSLCTVLVFRLTTSSWNMIFQSYIGQLISSSSLTVIIYLFVTTCIPFWLPLTSWLFFKICINKIHSLWCTVLRILTNA